MKTLTLHRNYFPHGVFSILCDDNGNAMLKTVERPWKDNQPGVSCIPEGEYDLIQHTSPKFGKCLAVDGEQQGVTVFGPSQRTHILFHPANLASQLEGCIAPGFHYGVVRNEWAVTQSRDAMTALMTYLDGENAKLIIKRA
ncbi:DUF5675 family protein [Vibrio europaeus]|uniref:DUF5675 family protein n=1 Tax=Vibrio europaeus TaxID=300876 RepID=UPI00233F3A5E|nr:DUF5675 family protein [Vibrio europaeus]MDC5753841.1 DUF5675 family protein [Vibrio europaeus]MDC5776753.1 DUF5675 family protein [Vibrio europaeus]MDC5796769.1 DUF5675 family protein [Vibrio europaeus]MDC5801766.1 DUF5675 family protein [Vibrio europaeus]MDC5815739.1 DUF5675 family protein [Vibrio europaeus]